jgi:hypothetical protein
MFFHVFYIQDHFNWFNLNGRIPFLFGANPHRFFHCGNENLAVTDLAGLGGLDDRT